MNWTKNQIKEIARDAIVRELDVPADYVNYNPRCPWNHFTHSDLALVEMIMCIEEEFGIEISDDEFKEITTPKKLYKHLYKVLLQEGAIDSACPDSPLAPEAPNKPEPLSSEDIMTLMDLAERLYHEQQERSGMITPIPYAYVEGEGKFLIVSNWAKDSAEIKSLLSERYGHA